MKRAFGLAGALVLFLSAWFTVPGTVEAAGPAITVDAGAVQGIVDPKVTGGMFEWATNEMNGVWADRVLNRSFENESVYSRKSPLYDHFDAASLDASRWTPMLLEGTGAGSVTQSGSAVKISGGGAASRFGIMSNDIPNAAGKTTTIETKVTAVTGNNALMNIYGGTGAGDFTKFVEYGIEGGVLKVFASGGAGNWTGGAVSLPATLKVVVSYDRNHSRNYTFFANGTQVYTLTGNSDVGSTYRVFLYGFGSSSTSWDYLTISQDSNYDAFAGTALSSLWTPTRIAGSTSGSMTVGSDLLTINGASGSRYGALSQPIRNSAVDWTTIDARLQSVTGTNALLSIYGGSGAGDFSKFVEFGVEGGVLKVFTASGTGNWSGGTVTAPGTLSVQVTPYYTQGRRFRFYWNGNLVHSLVDVKDVPAGDYRLFLYGFGASVTKWDYVNVKTEHFNEQFAPHFEGLTGEWQMELLEGSAWGSQSSSNSNVTINGAAGSRYGAMYPTLEESDIYGYTVSSRLVSYSGANAFMNLYAGSGRGDFSQFVEYGIEGGALKVYTASGAGNWTGPAVSTPAVLTVEVSPYGAGGRTLHFYYNNSLMYSLRNDTNLPNKDYQVFLYGYGNSTTTWDYMSPSRWGDWQEDGYADRARYSLDTANPYNGNYSQRIDLTQHTTGRKGISMPDIEVAAGKPYAFSVWLRQSGMSGPVTVTLGPAAGDSSTYPAYATGSIPSVSGSWTKYTLTLTPNATNKQAKLFIGFGTAGTLWIDMPSLMPTDPSEAVDGGFRTDWANAIAAAKPNMLRWPGGIIADWQHWQDGVGARDSRPPIYYGQWDSLWMTNDVGADEFLKFAANRNIVPFLNVNYGSATTAEAANWVQYTNGAASTTYGAMRAANGRTAPYNVKYWGIGNETWGSWTPGWTSNPSEYATNYAAFQTAMAAQDPTIDFTAEGGDGNNTSNAWNQTVVTAQGGKINNLAIHYYGPQVLPQGYNSLDVYKASVAAPITYASRMQATQNTILGITNRNIKLAIEEYNAMYFHDDQRRTRSVEAALQVAGFLNAIVRNPQLANFNAYSQVANFWDGGSIRTGVRGLLVTPSYHVLKMFGNYRGPVSLQTSVASSPTYNAPAVGNLPALTGVPQLDAVATKSAGGTELYLSVVNRSDTANLATTINLNNAGTIGGTATAYTVGNGVGYLTKNTWQSPNAVPLNVTTVSGVTNGFSYTFPAHSVTVLKFTVSAAAVSTPVVVGKVTNAAGTPLAGATVQVVGGASAVTNAAGIYSIPIPGAGTYDLKATLAGYSTAYKYAVVADSAGTTAMPIVMKP